MFSKLKTFIYLIGHCSVLMSGLRALTQLLDSKLKNILDVFLQNKGQLFHLKKLSEESKVPLATTFRLVSKLVGSGFLDITLVGKIKLYKIKEKLPSTDVLIDSKAIKLIRVFSENKDEIFHLKKLSSEAKVPLTTTSRLVSELVKKGFVEVVYVGKMKLYKTKRRVEF